MLLLIVVQRRFTRKCEIQSHNLCSRKIQKSTKVFQFQHFHVDFCSSYLIHVEFHKFAKFCLFVVLCSKGCFFFVKLCRFFSAREEALHRIMIALHLVSSFNHRSFLLSFKKKVQSRLKYYSWVKVVNMTPQIINVKSLNHVYLYIPICLFYIYIPIWQNFVFVYCHS